MTDFKSVKTHGDFWDPRKDAEGNIKTVATSEDAIECYYLGGEEGQGKDGTSTLHKILHLGVPPHGGAEAYMEKNVWGSHVLNEQLGKIPAGSFCRIQWLGMKEPKNPNNRQYHDWEVFLASDVPVLDAGQLQTMRADAAKAATAAQAAAPAPAAAAPAPAATAPAVPAAPATVPAAPAAAPASVPTAPPPAAPAAQPAAAPVAPATPAQPAVAPPAVDPDGDGTDELPF